MRKIISCVFVVFSGATFAQSLNCQLMKEEIIGQYRQQQAQSQQQAYNQNFNAVQLSPMEQGNLMMRQSAEQFGNALAMIGQPTLEQKVQIYKQRCE